MLRLERLRATATSTRAGACGARTAAASSGLLPISSDQKLWMAFRDSNSIALVASHAHVSAANRLHAALNELLFAE